MVAFFAVPVQIMAASNIIINEVAWAGTTDGWRYEWVELFNGTDSIVDIAGWQIDNGASSNKTLTLNGPAQSALRIEAGKYFLICRKELVLPALNGVEGSLSKGMAGCDLVETKLSLHNEYSANGKLVLKNNASNIIDTTPEPIGKTWPAGDNTTKHTMERTSGGWQNSADPNGTPKAQNSVAAPQPPIKPTPPVQLPAEPTPPAEKPSPTTSIVSPPPATLRVAMRAGPSPLSPSVAPTISAVYPAGVYFNEILPSPEGPDAENEWLELYNSNDFAVDLAGWRIKDKVGQTKLFVCPTDTIIEAQGFFLVLRPQSNITLQNSGDGLILFDPNQKIVDEVDYPKASQGQSYNKTDSGWAWSETLTPLQVNIISTHTLQQPLPAGESKGTGLLWAKNLEDTPNFEGLLSPTTTVASPLASMLAAKPPSKLPLFLLALLIAISTAIIAIFIKKGLQKR